MAGGYDSDVEREKSMDYGSLTYAAPIRDASALGVVKPHKQESKEEKGGASGRGKVSRAVQSSVKVVTREDKLQVKVITCRALCLPLVGNNILAKAKLCGPW